MRLSMRIRVPAAVGEHEYGSNKVHPPRIAVGVVAQSCNALSPKRKGKLASFENRIGASVAEEPSNPLLGVSS